MNWTKSFSEQLQEDVSKKLREEFPYLRRGALGEVAEQCKQTFFTEQMREFTQKRLRSEYPFLKQDAIAEIAQQCKQTISDRLTLEAPRMKEVRDRVNLLTLPAEVRNLISTMAVTIQKCGQSFNGPHGSAPIGHADFEVRTDFGFGDPGYYHDGSEDWRLQPPLTQACKQLREETLGIYYAANTFLLYAWDYGYQNISPWKIKLYSSGTKSWLEAIGAKNRDLIKSVLVLNEFENKTKTSAERFATALAAAGVGLNNCVFSSYRRGFGGKRLSVRWFEIKAKDDNIDKDATVEWDLSNCERYRY